jgi:SPP1 family predicted phage head-tail adaptor
MAADDELEIGERRWQVWLSRRTDTNDPTGPGLAQTFEHQAQVWASIQPVGTMTFYDTTQTDKPITHRIFIRWRADIRLFDYIHRYAIDPNGDPIEESFQIQRSSDWKGRKRFLMIDARLETKD